MLAFSLVPLLAVSPLAAPDLGGEFLVDVMRSGSNGGSTIFELFIAPDGSVEACDVTYTDRSEAAANRACGRMIGKRVAKGATTSEGTRVHGTLTFGAGTSPGLFPLQKSADLVISVQSLPQEPGTSLSVDMLVLVSGEGAIIECQPWGPNAKPNFNAVACLQLRQMSAPIRRDASGVAVPYVTDLKVEFSSDSAATN